jgi:hypothetical protein
VTDIYPRFVILTGVIGLFLTILFAPHSAVFSRVALPSLIVWFAIPWLALVGKGGLPALGSLITMGLLTGLPVILAPSARTYPLFLSVVLTLAIINSSILWRYTEEPSKILAMIHLLSASYLLGLCYWFRISELQGAFRPMTTRFLFGSPLMIPIFWSIAILSGWNRFFRLAILACLGQTGIGLMDISSRQELGFVGYIGLSFGIVFVVGTIWTLLYRAPGASLR